MAFSIPTRLKKMKLNSVDFVRRGANPEADIELFKSADYTPEDDEMMDVEKAEYDLTTFTDVLGESFSSIMKDDSLTDDERISMVAKSLSEFNDTVGEYMQPFGILEKSFNSDFQTVVANKSSKLGKGDKNTMANLAVNVDKSLLTPEEASTLDALIKKASTPEFPPKKEVDPAKAQEVAEKDAKLPPEVEKVLAEVEEMKKSFEMRELEAVAKKYEILGKKPADEAQTLYNLKKSGEANYNAYVAAMDAQVALVEKSGMFAEIGKSGGYGYTSLAKGEPESKVEAIAKSYMEKEPTMDYNTALMKAWENHPELMAEYDRAYNG